MSLGIPLMMGISLATATGLRAWLPLLMTLLFVYAGEVAWNTHFAFLTGIPVIAIVGLLTLLEIGADLLPGIHHGSDMLHTLLRPISAALLMAGLLVELPPAIALLIGILVGGSISGLVHGVRIGGRVILSAMTLGLLNVLTSLFETLVACLLSLFALTAPGVVFLLTLGLLLLTLWLGHRLWKRLRSQSVRLKRRVQLLFTPAPKQLLIPSESRERGSWEDLDWEDR